MNDFDVFGTALEGREWEVAGLPGRSARSWIIVEKGTTRPYPSRNSRGPRRFVSYDAAQRFLASLTGEGV